MPLDVPAQMPNGWKDAGVFVKWMHHCICHVKASTTNRQLIVRDGHCSHKMLEGTDLARDNDIEILVLPPHTTHHLQPQSSRSHCLQCCCRSLDDHTFCKVHFSLSRLFVSRSRTATVAKSTSGNCCTGM